MFTQRNYQGEADQKEMLQLSRLFSDEHLHVADLPYRFSSWAFDDSQNARLWFNGSQIIGWAVLQSPFWALDYALHPEYASTTLPEILAWADWRARQLENTPYQRPAWFVSVFDSQHDQRRLLEQAGFSDQGQVEADPWTKVWLIFQEENQRKKHILPPGFTLRTLAGSREAGAYVDLHQSVFESKNMTLAWRQRTLAQPDYSPQSDLVMIAPDGRLAAFCIGWVAPGVNESAPFGQIEPLGVLERFRGLGLGSAILSACLESLRSLGAQQVVVETDSYRDPARNLYETMGFKLHRQGRVYRKDYPVE